MYRGITSPAKLNRAIRGGLEPEARGRRQEGTSRDPSECHVELLVNWEESGMLRIHFNRKIKIIMERRCQIMRTEVREGRESLGRVMPL